MDSVYKASFVAVSALLDELLDADDSQRAERLAKVRSEDPDLATQVAALLSEQQAVVREGFLEGTALSRVGAFRILPGY